MQTEILRCSLRLRRWALLALSTALIVAACPDDVTNGTDAGDSAAAPDVADVATAPDTTPEAGGPDASGVTDIRDATFANRDPACSAYVGSYQAQVQDSSSGMVFNSTVTITDLGTSCSITSNSIPNHDFNDTDAFAHQVAEVVETFNLPASPSPAAASTALTLAYDNAVFLNGAKLDLLAAACYGVGNEPLGQERIGCSQSGTPWRYDPMHPNNSFGTDSHNAHTQPDGAYHYHGDPNAMYDASGATASGVIGFAADGFPVYGPWFDDNGTIRRAVSGFTLKTDMRQSQPGEGAFPAGSYDGTFIDDYEWTGAGDLDECNGMTVDGSYGYYVTDSYPWVLKCFKGAPDPSFQKTMGRP